MGPRADLGPAPGARAGLTWRRAAAEGKAEGKAERGDTDARRGPSGSRGQGEAGPLRSAAPAEPSARPRRGAPPSRRPNFVLFLFPFLSSLRALPQPWEHRRGGSHPARSGAPAPYHGRRTERGHGSRGRGQRAERSRSRAARGSRPRPRGAPRDPKGSATRAPSRCRTQERGRQPQVLRSRGFSGHKAGTPRVGDALRLRYTALPEHDDPCPSSGEGKGVRPR